MKTLAQRFLTEQEQQRITDAVQQAERQTSGEIVPMVVSASHDYPLAPVVGSTLMALPAGIIGARALSGYFWTEIDQLWLFLLCFGPLFVLGHQTIKRVPSLLRLFLSNRQAEREVERAAMLAFYTERLYKTKAENGVLLYISVLEQRVWVLGDRGVDEKIDQHRWQDIVSLVTDGIKAGRPCDAICHAISRIGELLRESFPQDPGDKNELHNLIIR